MIVVIMVAMPSIFVSIFVPVSSIMTSLSSTLFTFFSCSLSLLLLFGFPYFLCFFKTFLFNLPVGKHFLNNLFCIIRVITNQNIVKN
uniref:Uncharacterized protein n=1 Tax=Glycine max TaxID=3847 RepID=C6TMF9_SOYBN|nr:unknown [Glycine max]